MATRCTTTAYAPAPPIYKGLRSKVNGVPATRIVIKTTASATGIKPNMGCPPATNGDRASGLAPSQPRSAKAQKGIRAVI